MHLIIFIIIFKYGYFYLFVKNKEQVSKLFIQNADRQRLGVTVACIGSLGLLCLGCAHLIHRLRSNLK